MAPKRRGKKTTKGRPPCDVRGVFEMKLQKKLTEHVHIGGQLNNRHNNNNKVNKFKRRGRPGKERSILLRSKIDFVVKKASGGNNKKRKKRRRRVLPIAARCRASGDQNINIAVSKDPVLVNKIDGDVLMDTGIGATEDKEHCWEEEDDSTTGSKLRVTCGDNSAILSLRRLDSGSRGACVLYANSWLTPNEFQYISGRGSAKDWKRSIKHGDKSLKLLQAKGLLSLKSSRRCRCQLCAGGGGGDGDDDDDKEKVEEEHEGEEEKEEGSVSMDTDTESTQTADEGGSVPEDTVDKPTPGSASDHVPDQATYPVIIPTTGPAQAGDAEQQQGDGLFTAAQDTMDIPVTSDSRDIVQDVCDMEMVSSKACSQTVESFTPTRVKGYSVSDLLGDLHDSCQVQKVNHNGRASPVAPKLDHIEEYTSNSSDIQATDNQDALNPNNPDTPATSSLGDPDDEDDDNSDDIPSHTIITVPIKRGRGRPPKKKRGRVPHKVFKITIPQKRAKIDEDSGTVQKSDLEIKTREAVDSPSRDVTSINHGFTTLDASLAVNTQSQAPETKNLVAAASQLSYKDTTEMAGHEMVSHSFTPEHSSKTSSTKQGPQQQEHDRTVNEHSNLLLNKTDDFKKDIFSSHYLAHHKQLDATVETRSVKPRDQPVRFWDDPPKPKKDTLADKTEYKFTNEVVQNDLANLQFSSQTYPDFVERKDLNKESLSSDKRSPSVKDDSRADLDTNPTDSKTPKPKSAKVSRLLNIIDSLKTSKVTTPPQPEKSQSIRNPRKNAIPRQCLSNNDIDEEDSPSPVSVDVQQEKVPCSERKLSPKPEKEPISTKPMSADSNSKLDFSSKFPPQPLDDHLGLLPGIPPPMMNIPPAMYLNMFQGGMPLEWQMHMAMMNRQLGPYELALLASSLNAQSAHLSNKLSIPELNGRSAVQSPCSSVSPNSCLPKPKTNSERQHVSSKKSEMNNPVLGGFQDVYNHNLLGLPSAASHLSFLDHLQPKQGHKSSHVPVVTSQNRVTNISNSFVSTWNPHKQLQPPKEPKPDRASVSTSSALDLSRKHPYSTSSSRTANHSVPRTMHHHNGPTGQPMDLSYRK